MVPNGVGSGDGLEGEVREEVSFHIEAQARDLVREGWSEEAAWAEARRRFGNAESVAAELLRMGRRRRRMIERGRRLDQLGQDLGFALRQLRRHPAFAAATTLVIALGVGVATAVFAVADAALLRPLPFPEPDRLVRLFDVQDQPGYPPSLPEFQDWERDADFLASAAAAASNVHVLQLGELPERVEVGLVAGDLGSVLGLSLLAGRIFTPEELATHAPVLLLDEDFWRDRLAGDAGVVGTTLSIDGEPVTVVGVAPRELRLLFDEDDAQLWRPMPDLPDVLDRGLHLLTAVGRLRDGVALEQANEWAARLAADIQATGVTRHGLQVASLREQLVGDTGSVVLVLAGAVVLVLLVVSANLAHLSLARGWARARELAVRGALGAGRVRLVRQLVTEAVVLALLGGAGGLLIARAVTGWVALAADSVAVSELSRAGGPRVVLFALAVALAVGSVFGMVSARRATGSDPAAGLAGGHTRAQARARLRQGLVATEIALSAVLLTGAGLLVRTVGRLLNEDTGFRAEGVLTAEVALPGTRYPVPADRARFWEELLERTRGLPGVESAGLVSHLPLTGDTNGGFRIVGRDFPEGESPHAKKRFAGPGAFEAMGVPLLRGRPFLPSDRLGEPEVAVISEALAERYWPGEDPIGRKIRFLWQTDAEQEIVGVVGDVRDDALDQEGYGTIYLAHAQIGPSGMSLVVHAPSGPRALAEPLRRAVLEIDPAQPIHDVVTLEAIVRDSVAARLTVMRLLSAFALLALLLAAVAVYAVAAQSVSSRTREIGVRLAVGAAPERVMRRLLGVELVPVAAGLVVGLLGAVLAGRVLAGFLYGVGASDPLTLVTVGVVLGGAALLALALPARRVLRVDPAVVLRGE